MTKETSPTEVPDGGNNFPQLVKRSCALIDNDTYIRYNKYRVYARFNPKVRGVIYEVGTRTEFG